MASRRRTSTARPTGARREAARSGRGAYVPDAGDFIWLEFDPQAGREQGGRRPALVLSPAGYNGRTDLAIVCPVTNQRKGYPFEVSVPEGLRVPGVILADHVKCLDWRSRQAAAAGRATADVLNDVRAKLATLIGT